MFGGKLKESPKDKLKKGKEIEPFILILTAALVKKNFKFIWVYVYTTNKKAKLLQSQTNKNFFIDDKSSKQEKVSFFHTSFKRQIIQQILKTKSVYNGHFCLVQQLRFDCI